MAMAVVPSVVFRFLPVVSVLIVASTAQSLEQVSGSSSSPSSLPLTSSVESIAHAAATPSVTCRFDDVASATVVSAVVFEGRVDHVTRTSSADDAVTYAVFRVRTLIKGSLQLSESTSGVTERSIPQYRPVAVALTPIKSCSTEGGVADSMPEMKTGAVYVVFAGEKISVVAQNATSSGGKRRRPVDLLRMLRRPEMSSEATLKAVQQFSSSRYGECTSVAFCASFRKQRAFCI
jgi:hypothetical protein